MRGECGALVLSNVQPHAAVPFLVGARRLGLPIVAHVASWDHTVGKGVIAPFCDAYIVQNEAMRDDLARYHGDRPGARRRHAAGRRPTSTRCAARARTTRASSARSGSIRRRRSSSSWATRPRTRPSKIASSSAWSTGGRPRARTAVAALPSASARPEWRERFRAALEDRGRGRAGGELHRLRGARDAPAALRLRCRERRNDPARRARQRPSRGMRPLRRGRAFRRELRAEERHRRALPRARGVDAPSTGRSRSRRSSPGSSARSRSRPSSPTSGGASRSVSSAMSTARAGARVVDAIVEIVSASDVWS